MSTGHRIPRDAQAVLDFWFGAPGSPMHGSARAEWFRKDAAFDASIAQRFGPTIAAAQAGGLSLWDATPWGALARIVVLDQFPRNVFRGSARAFAGDASALAAARALVTGRHEHELPPVCRSFVYLPFEHAEDLAAQDESVRLFTQLVSEAPALVDMLDYAQRHRDVVRRFGRFPHRNEALGKESSAEEIDFLRQPGSRF